MSEIDYRRAAYEESEGKRLFPEPNYGELRAEFEAWFVPRETQLENRARAEQIECELEKTRAAKREAADRKHAEQLEDYRRDEERLDGLRREYELKRIRKREAESEAWQHRRIEFARTFGRQRVLEAEFEERRAKAEAPYRPSREGNLGEVEGQAAEASLYLDEPQPVPRIVTDEEASTFLIEAVHAQVFCGVCDMACGRDYPIPLSPHGWVLPHEMARGAKWSYACRQCAERQSQIEIPFLASDIIIRSWDVLQRRNKKNERDAELVARWDRIQELVAKGESRTVVARDVGLSTSQVYRLSRSPRPTVAAGGLEPPTLGL